MSNSRILGQGNVNVPSVQEQDNTVLLLFWIFFFLGGIKNYLFKIEIIKLFTIKKAPFENFYVF